MNVEWATLGQVILASVLLTVAVVGLFSVGIRAGLSPSTKPAAKPAGYLSFALCAAAVGYGIWVITS